jgi:hypothetical protein
MTGKKMSFGTDPSMLLDADFLAHRCRVVDFDQLLKIGWFDTRSIGVSQDLGGRKFYIPN